MKNQTKFTDVLLKGNMTIIGTNHHTKEWLLGRMYEVNTLLGIAESGEIEQLLTFKNVEYDGNCYCCLSGRISDLTIELYGHSASKLAVSSGFHVFKAFTTMNLLEYIDEADMSQDSQYNILMSLAEHFKVRNPIVIRTAHTMDRQEVNV